MTAHLSDHVDPTIGTLPLMLAPTIPEVQLPHGMMGVAPAVIPAIDDQFLAERINGFGFGDLNRRGGHCTRIMATSGSAGDISSEYDNDHATVRPHRAAYRLETFGVSAEYTVAQRSAMFRFAFASAQTGSILLLLHPAGSITHVEADSVAGFEERPTYRMYFHARISRPSAERTELGREQPGIRFGFPLGHDEEIVLKIGISYIDGEQARQNLDREIPHWDFERLCAEARGRWDEALGRIRIDGGTAAQRQVFYTALYRCLCRMRDHDEYGRYYSPVDRQVHESRGLPFHIHDWSWDTHRTAHPLQCLIEPERRDAIVQSYVRMFEQSGWLPTFPTMRGGAGHAMIGFPSHGIVLDAYRKGFRGFDARSAYEGMRKNALLRTRVPPLRSKSQEQCALDRFYFDKGYMPALRPGEVESEPSVTFSRQAVSVTLEQSYSDWCVAEMARELGREADAEQFARMAGNYRQVFRPDIGFMAPKDADGAWIEPFDPIWSGGQAGRDYYTECNAWIYTFSVQHDPQGLARLLGGPAGLQRKLDALFTTHLDGGPKWRFWGQWPDSTGLIGMYCHGNEPSFHIPYLYNHTDAPWRGQKRLRQIMDLMYTPTANGLCGDDDQGALSSWYVFSAMGFYPLCPGDPTYEIGSPLFERAVLQLGGGRTFTIEAPGASARAKYVTGARLDGTALARPRFGHGPAMSGTSRLELAMSERPGWSG